MLLKSSIITSDTKEKSLQYLSNKSYNSSGYIKHKLVVTAFNLHSALLLIFVYFYLITKIFLNNCNFLSIKLFFFHRFFNI